MRTVAWVPSSKSMRSSNQEHPMSWLVASLGIQERSERYLAIRPLHPMVPERPVCGAARVLGRIRLAAQGSPRGGMVACMTRWGRPLPQKMLPVISSRRYLVAAMMLIIIYCI